MRPKKEQRIVDEFWSKESEKENLALLGKISRLKKQGMNVMGLLDNLISDKSGGGATWLMIIGV
jgi:hypothetical protein